MTKTDLTKPEDIQKEFEKMVKEKFGSGVQVITQAFDGNVEPPTSENKAAKSEESTEKDSNLLEKIKSFKLLPKELKEKLDEYIISQDEAKKALAIAICDHYNQVRYFESLSEEQRKDHEYAKQNVLLLGPTGVGKTYMVKQIAKEIGVPFVRADATKYSETGYMGANVEDLMKDLLHQAGDDLELAQYGIVYIDEADKLASRNTKHHGKDVNGRGVQLSLLKLMEETDVDLRGGNDPSSQMQAFMDMQRSGGKLAKKVMNTKHILFILSGAFTDLPEIIGKRLNVGNIGFDPSKNRHPKKVALADAGEVTTEDLIEFGLEPEFIGRLPVKVSCNHLSVEHLYSILKDSKGSILHQYHQAFSSYGISLKFEESALKRIAELAHKENTGARSLMTIIERSLRDFKYHLPSSHVRKLIVTRETIDDPASTLNKLLEDQKVIKSEIKAHVTTFEKKFFEEHGIEIFFDDGAIDRISDLVEDEESETAVDHFLSKTLQGYEYGLKLVEQNSGQKTMTIGSDCIESPRTALENWIRNSLLENEKPDPTTTNKGTNTDSDNLIH